MSHGHAFISEVFLIIKILLRSLAINLVSSTGKRWKQDNLPLNATEKKMLLCSRDKVGGSPQLNEKPGSKTLVLHVITGNNC